MDSDISSSTDIARWSNLENLDDQWSYRSERAARFIPPGATLMDIGCGKMAIEKMLPQDCKYIPVDVVARDARTIIRDLNKGEYPPADGATHICVLGVLEYLNDPEAFFEWLSRTAASRLILSYITSETGTESPNRRDVGWVNDLTEAGIIDLAKKHGFTSVFEEWLTNNRLFVFDRASQAKRIFDMRYGLLSYTTTNLGDEIQSIAAQQFLPSTNVLINRDQLNLPPDDSGERCKIILNGWHTHKPENWPPSDLLDALLVSFHITDEVTSENTSQHKPSEMLLEGKSLDYLRAHAPIGSRDLWTRDLLKKKNIDAYFSGCMTLTLGTGQPAQRHDYVGAVDLDKPVLKQLQNRISSRIVTTTHEDTVPAPFAQRAARAKRLLGIYAHAKSVVTSRLHCALPCLALGTPVLFVISAKDTYRFSGLSDLVRHCSKKEFLGGKVDFDPDNPSPNSDAYLKYRYELVRTVNRFIGGDAAALNAPLHPFVPDADPESLIAAEQSLQKARAANASVGMFRSVFKAGRNYASTTRVDFLRDLARVHRAIGNLEEAKRLLEIAHAERPERAYIKKLLDEVSQELGEC